MQICFGEPSAAKLQAWAQKHYEGTMQLTVRFFLSSTSQLHHIGLTMSHGLLLKQRTSHFSHLADFHTPEVQQTLSPWLIAEVQSTLSQSFYCMAGQKHSWEQSRKPHSRCIESSCREAYWWFPSKTQNCEIKTASQHSSWSEFLQGDALRNFARDLPFMSKSSSERLPCICNIDFHPYWCIIISNHNGG